MLQWVVSTLGSMAVLGTKTEMSADPGNGITDTTAASGTAQMQVTGPTMMTGDSPWSCGDGL